MTHYLELFVPLIISNVAHMFVVKFDGFACLKIPISVRAFGTNKTVRGFVFVGVLTGVLQVILNRFLHGAFQFDSFVLGLSLGVTYMLCELPNSFLKRRMGIQSGQKAAHRAWLFTLLDKSDSTLGVCLVFTLYKGLSASVFFQFFLVAFCIHLTLSKVLQLLRVKESL